MLLLATCPCGSDFFYFWKRGNKSTRSLLIRFWFFDACRYKAASWAFNGRAFWGFDSPGKLGKIPLCSSIFLYYRFSKHGVFHQNDLVKTRVLWMRVEQFQIDISLCLEKLCVSWDFWAGKTDGKERKARLNCMMSLNGGLSLGRLKGRDAQIARKLPSKTFIGLRLQRAALVFSVWWLFSRLP